MPGIASDRKKINVTVFLTQTHPKYKSADCRLPMATAFNQRQEQDLQTECSLRLKDVGSVIYCPHF